MMSGNDSSMPVKPALLIASSFRGRVSALLLPIEHVAYDKGMLRRDSYVIVGASAIMVFSCDQRCVSCRMRLEMQNSNRTGQMQITGKKSIQKHM